MREIDLKSWPRKNSFDFFKEYEFPHFNICANVRITETYHYLQEKGISKFNAMLWLLSDTANNIAEFRQRFRQDRVVEHSQVHPSFAWLNADKSLTFCLAEYSKDISIFFDNVRQSVKKADPNPLIADKKTADNLLYISCVPWINFTAAVHPIKLDNTASIPRISWGKFTQEHEQWIMPVSLQVHHGLADGYHAGLFFEYLQKNLDQPKNIDWPL